MSSDAAKDIVVALDKTIKTVDPSAKTTDSTESGGKSELAVVVKKAPAQDTSGVGVNNAGNNDQVYYFVYVSKGSQFSVFNLAEGWGLRFEPGRGNKLHLNNFRPFLNSKRFDACMWMKLESFRSR